MSLSIRLSCDEPDPAQIGGTCRFAATYPADTVDRAYVMAERAGWKITRPATGRPTPTHLCPRHNPARIPGRNPSSGGRA